MHKNLGNLKIDYCLGQRNKILKGNNLGQQAKAAERIEFYRSQADVQAVRYKILKSAFYQKH